MRKGKAGNGRGKKTWIGYTCRNEGAGTEGGYYWIMPKKGKDVKIWCLER